MERLPLETQTLYAELLDQLTALEAEQSIGRLQGCFVTKPGRDGAEYVYFQHSEPGNRRRQIYLGRKDAALASFMHRYEREREEFRGDVGTIERLCAQLRAGGARMTDHRSARVLRALAESGVFRLGGVLVGTHAFTILGNLLGVRWKRSAVRTQDVDIAADSSLHIAVPALRADVPRALESLGMGFLPVPPLDPTQPSTSFKVRGQTLRVDLLTPARRAGQTAPVPIPRLAAAAQPLPGLEYLLEEPVRAAVIDAGGVSVQVPAPARFAFHKLATAENRPPTEQSKTEKDRIQATQILEFLLEERPGDLRIAWDDLNAIAALRRGAELGLQRLTAKQPALSNLCRDLL